MMTLPRAVLITGAGSGIGASLALGLAGPDRCLTLHTRQAAERLAAVAEAARARGAQVETVLGDLAEPGVAGQVVEAHERAFGALDALVANAGFPLLKSFDDMKPDDIAYAFRGNSQSLFELVQASLGLLRRSDGARVVTVGSFTAHSFRTDMPQFPASAASKGAVETATRSLALALAPDGITVNCVVPGYIRKDAGTADALDPDTLREIQGRIPLQRLGEPEDVAQCMRFLLSREAAYITGQIIHVNGGLV